MESFSELIGKRRSIRKFTPEKLDPEAVRLLLRAALISPSSKGTHSYEFVVVEDPQMITARACGVLLPVSSLPSKYGIGCFSKEAFRFVDFLEEAGQSFWQILPSAMCGSRMPPLQPPIFCCRPRI